MKSGIVTLAGRSNVGKSTLVNTLVGTKVSITSPKAQTTRESARGIYTDERGQIVFIDSPGIFESARSPLTRSVNAAARSSLHGVNVILYVVDPTRAIGTEEHRIHTLLRMAGVPTILVLNKADLPDAQRPYIDAYRDLVRDDDDVLAEVHVSALSGAHCKQLIDEVFLRLPEGELLYPVEQQTDIPPQHWFSELIREKIFLVMHQEIPYTTMVAVDELTERVDGTLFIAARILTTNDRYKRMLIGDGGRRIKQIGQMTRKELELVLQRKIFLELHVSVDAKWGSR